jgi:hypothetical protein
VQQRSHSAPRDRAGSVASRRSDLAYLKHVFRKQPQTAVEVAAAHGLLPQTTQAHQHGAALPAAQERVLADAYDVRGASGQVLFQGMLDNSQNTPQPARQAAVSRRLACTAGGEQDTAARKHTLAASMRAPCVVMGFGHSSRGSTPADVYGVPPLSPAAALSGLPYARQPRLARFQSDKHRAQKEARAMGVL